MIYNFFNSVYENLSKLYNNIRVIDRGVLINYGYISFRYSYLLYKGVKRGVRYVKNSINYGMEYILGETFKEEIFKCYEIKQYDTFKVYSYKIIKDENIYFFDYLLKNECKNNEEMLNKMLKDTYENIIEKDNNKQMILYINLMLSDETILCDILDDINKLRYHFDCVNEEITLRWRHIYDIIKHKYTNDDIDINLKNERLNYLNDINNVYIFMILNDESLSEKVIMLSSILDKYILF